MPSRPQNLIGNPIGAQNPQIQNQNNFNRPNTSSMNTNQNTQAPLSDSEEFVLKSFEKFRDHYFECFNDETKQKDFNNKIISLQNKLKNHELKQNLLNILGEFINCKIFFSHS